MAAMDPVGLDPGEVAGAWLRPHDGDGDPAAPASPMMRRTFRLPRRRRRRPGCPCFPDDEEDDPAAPASPTTRRTTQLPLLFPRRGGRPGFSDNDDPASPASPSRLRIQAVPIPLCCSLLMIANWHGSLQAFDPSVACHVMDNTSMESKEMANWTTEALVAVQESLRHEVDEQSWTNSKNKMVEFQHHHPLAGMQLLNNELSKLNHKGKQLF
ncbi:hypothetical protein EJB05_33842, partial [Eragrostis curvula]